MPYVITTKPGERVVWEGARSTVVTVPPTTRRAVATLDEARCRVNRRVLDAFPEPGVSPKLKRLNIAACFLPESGGTVGPLPDGTVIEVTPVHCWTSPNAVEAFNAKHAV